MIGGPGECKEPVALPSYLRSVILHAAILLFIFSDRGGFSVFNGHNSVPLTTVRGGAIHTGSKEGDDGYGWSDPRWRHDER